MDESDHKTKLVGLAKKTGWYARRVEDKYQVGFPDMIFKPVHRQIVFVEAKMVVGKTFGPTARQLIDLQALHDPPYSFAFVLGIEDTGSAPGYHLSVPLAEINKFDKAVLHTSDFLRGVQMLMDREIRYVKE